MIAVGFTTLAILGLLNIVAHVYMQVRVYRSDSSRDRLAWFGTRGGDAVAEAYATLFPDSLLPKVREWLFIALISFAVLILALVLIR